MKVQVEGLDSFIPDAPLGGRYLVRITDSKLTNNEQSMQINWEVIDGQNDVSGKPAIGRTGIEFLRVDLTNIATDKGRKFLLERIDKALTCFGIQKKNGSFDSDDFAGKEGWVQIRQKKDMNGVLRENITEYFPS